MWRPVRTSLDNGDLCFGFELAQLHPEGRLNGESIAREATAFITALEGQRDARFVVQILGRPAPASPGQGRLEVHLLVAMPGTSDDERVDELADDLLDLLAAPPVRWTFRPIQDLDELTRVLTPFTPTHLAEVARREEPCLPTSWEGGLGFAGAPGRRSPQRDLWSMWTFGPATDDLRRLGSVLLAQEAPVCIRTTLAPTELTDTERLGIEELTRDLGDGLVAGSLGRAALSTIQSLVSLRPVFDARCVIASPEPISRSLLSAIGHGISEPAHHGAPTAILQGGFAVLRADHDVDGSILLDAYHSLSAGEPVPSLAPPGLDRLRRLFGPWEAAHLFRFPTTDEEGFPGLSTLRLPDLEVPLAELAIDGNVIGHLATDARTPVRLDHSERFRHTYVVGQTGTGKSTLLLQLALQDIAAGAGVALIDPHGDLVQEILGRIPDDRLDDVVLVDPADPVAVVGVNLLEAETPAQRDHLVSELAAMFYALFDPNRLGIVGPRYETWLRQAALLLLANPDQPSSLLDLPTVFTDQRVRAQLVENIDDPILAEFWLGEMSQTTDFHMSEVLGWFRSKFEIFRTSQLVRNVLGQARSTISFTQILDEQKILLVNLSKGLLGQYNSALIGHVLFTKIWSAALERAGQAEEERRDFFLYIDEFQNMTTESLPAVLSEARKFRLGVTIANQFFTQVPDQTRDSIMGNVGSRITFRLGPKDAAPFAGWLGPEVDAHELTRMPNHVAVAALSSGGVPVSPFVLRTDLPHSSWSSERAEQVRRRSRDRWATPVEELDAAFFSRWDRLHAAATNAPLTATRSDRSSPLPPDWLDRWVVTWVLDRTIDRTTDLRIEDARQVDRTEYLALVVGRVGLSTTRAEELLTGSHLSKIGLRLAIALRYELERLGASVSLTPDAEPTDLRTQLDDDGPLGELGLSRRSVEALTEHGVRTVGDLTSRTADQLLEVRSFGERSLAQTRETLAAWGLQLAGDPPPPVEVSERGLRRRGLGGLTPDEMASLLAALQAEFEGRVGRHLLDALTPEQIDRFERAKAASDDAGRAMLGELMPDHLEVFRRFLTKLLDEVRRARVPLLRAVTSARSPDPE